jgi:hypothetical protein
VGADQRQDLPGGGEEGHGVNQAQEPEQNEARDPVLIGRRNWSRILRSIHGHFIPMHFNSGANS